MQSPGWIKIYYQSPGFGWETLGVEENKFVPDNFVRVQCLIHKKKKKMKIKQTDLSKSKCCFAFAEIGLLYFHFPFFWESGMAPEQEKTGTSLFASTPRVSHQNPGDWYYILIQPGDCISYADFSNILICFSGKDLVILTDFQAKSGHGLVDPGMPRANLPGQAKKPGALFSQIWISRDYIIFW